MKLEIEELLKEGNEIHEIIDICLNTEGKLSFILKRLSAIIDREDDTFLHMTRACLWNKAKVFL